MIHRLVISVITMFIYIYMGAFFLFKMIQICIGVKTKHKLWKPISYKSKKIKSLIVMNTSRWTHLSRTHMYIYKCISRSRCVHECYFVPCRLYQWCHIQGRNVWQKVANVSWANLSCSSLVKSNPAWLGPEELKIDGKKRGAPLYNL